ncbi:MAG: 30S ribosomal protein S4 [Chloroflexi bacterium]|nr:30S ribosomal protein S4 [Chloroflexota bacterium]
MARYTGPVCKLCRREGMKLYLKAEKCITKCTIERRPSPPGQQGTGRRRRPTEYALQWREKQKVRRIYGVLEAQFRRHFAEAERRAGSTGESLLQILETRLDNVVYRMGLGGSRAQARQLVRHGHFMVNGRKTNIPSALVKPGDKVAVREGSREIEVIRIAAEGTGQRQIPAWLSFDPATLSARINTLPSRNEIDAQISEQLVVEFYAR